MKVYPAILLLCLGACAQKVDWANAPPATAQPRALLWGAALPNCWLSCQIVVSVINAEGDRALNSTGVTQSKAQTTSQSATQTFNPNLSRTTTDSSSPLPVTVP